MKYDIERITKYMIEYDTGVPSAVVIGIFLLTCVLIIIQYRSNTDAFKFIRNVSWCIVGGYFLFILCSTVLFRDKAEEIRIFLLPFWSYASLYDSRISEIILNVLMFVPIGFFCGIAIRNASILKVMTLGSFLSFFIEILQLMTRSGIFNIDDIIHNTFGSVIGFFCSVLFYQLTSKKLRHIDR